SPVNVGGKKLAGGDPSNPLRQLRVARRTQADVVRKDGGSAHVVVAVNRIDAVQERNSEPAFEGFALHAVHHVRPRLGIVWRWIASAATQRGADAELPDRSLGKAVHIDLSHLSDLLEERHALHESLGVQVIHHWTRERRARWGARSVW